MIPPDRIEAGLDVAELLAHSGNEALEDGGILVAGRWAIDRWGGVTDMARATPDRCVRPWSRR